MFREDEGCRSPVGREARLVQVEDEDAGPQEMVRGGMGFMDASSPHVPAEGIYLQNARHAMAHGVFLQPLCATVWNLRRRSARRSWRTRAKG